MTRNDPKSSSRTPTAYLSGPGPDLNLGTGSSAMSSMRAGTSWLTQTARCARKSPRLILHDAIGEATSRDRTFWATERQVERPTDD